MANNRIHRMSLDTEVLSTLTGIDRVNAITSHIVSLPQDLRGSTVRTYLRDLPEPEAARLTYNWHLHARDSQLPPPGDWDTWMILAGRGFGKTRTGAEWVRAQVEDGAARRIALVARTLDEAQSVMIEGESGIVNISPHWDKPIYEPSKRKLTWPNGAHALAFSSHEPDQLRGPQFDAAWCDELSLVGVPRTDLGQPHFRPQARTPATLRRHHNAQVHRACPQPPQQARRPSHPRIHLRESGQPAARLLQPAYRAVRRHTHRTAGDLRRAYRRGRRCHLETRVDREGPPLKPSPGCPNRRRNRPRHVHQAQQLRDRHRSRRCRHAPKARLRPRRRVRQAHPQLLGIARRPPIRQVQRHPYHRRGQCRRRHGQIHPQERR